MPALRLHVSRRCAPYSCRLSLTSAAPWWLPIHKVGGPLDSSRLESCVRLL